MTDNDVDATPCANLPPVQDFETTYFVQVAPMVYDFDQTRAAILPAKVKGLGADVVSPDGILEHLNRLRQTLKNKKVKKPAQFTNVIKQGMGALGSPWYITGKATENAQWAVGIEFAQTWSSRGFKRGRLVNSVPLTLFPGTKEISVRSWVRRIVKSTISESSESLTTSELSDEEKWSLSAKKALTNQNNTSFNPSATINQVTIPGGPIPVSAGGNLGIAGQIGSQVTRSLENGREFVQTATVKATQSLKIARNNTVEETTETGRETSTKETISNPNHCNTLNYLYYEVLEEIEICTRLSSVNLYLLVALPIEQNVTEAWLLEYECTLRPLIACEKLQAGFDAAKKLAVLRRVALLRKLREKAEAIKDAKGGGGAGGSTSDTPATKPLTDAIDKVLTSYAKLSGADEDSGPGSWLYWAFVDRLAPELRDALGVLEDRMDGATARQKGDQSFLSDVLTQFFTKIGSVDDAFVKVDSAVVIAGGATLATIALLPFGVVIAPIVAGFLAILELAGIDAVPDDENLRSRVISLEQKYDALIAPAEAALVPPPGTGQPDAAAGPTQAEILQRLLLVETELQERAEAEVEVRRLKSHIIHNLLFYYQAIWSTWPDVVVAEHLRQYGIPEDLVEPRFACFRGHYGACRVLNLEVLQKAGLDFSLLRKALLVEAGRHDGTYTHRMMVPTPGFVVEPLLGTCIGTDSFVLEHRALDLRARAAEVSKAEAESAQSRVEADRRKARIDGGDLSDPSPLTLPPIDVELTTHTAPPAGPET